VAGNGDDRICDDDVILEKISQFECNEYLETTSRARLNPKDIDKCIRVVKETASKNSQTVRRWGRVGPDTGKRFRRDSHGKLSAKTMKAIIVIWDLLHQVERLHVCGGKETFYILEPKGVHTLGRLRQLPHHDACTHMEPPYTTRIVSQNGTPTDIPYRLWGRVIVCCIVIGSGCVDVTGVLHFILHEYIPCWLRDALPRGALLVITSHMRVLKNDTHE
jgi:hypothetical protein